jgi:hypothetical protein
MADKPGGKVVVIGVGFENIGFETIRKDVGGGRLTRVDRLRSGRLRVERKDDHDFEARGTGLSCLRLACGSCMSPSVESGLSPLSLLEVIES